MVTTNPILKWTGHPLVDAGVAGITAFSGAFDPSEVTAQDLDDFARWARDNFTTKALSSFMATIFLNHMNYGRQEEVNKALAETTVRSYSRTLESANERCGFCGETYLQRVSRDLMPLIGGRTMINFFPQGGRGLPVCGVCLTSLQGLTVGAPFCSGRALVISTTNRSLLLQLVSGWVKEFQRLLSLSSASEELPKARGAKTRTVELLIRAQRAAQREVDDSTLVAYHLSSSGQTPGIDIFVLSASVVRFIRLAQTPRYSPDWRELSRRAWEPIKGGRTAADLPEDAQLSYYNYLYEDLFRLPDSTSQFVRRYFLQRPTRAAPTRSGKKQGIQPPQPTAFRAVSWDFIDLFLREVVNMEPTRIEAIRNLGDRLAEHIHGENDKRLFLTAFRVRQYFFARKLLLGKCVDRLRDGEGPIVGFDEFLTIFEEGDELARVDWRLAWDLVLIRVIERLHDLRSPVIEDPEVQQEASDEFHREEDIALAE